MKKSYRAPVLAFLLVSIIIGAVYFFSSEQPAHTERFDLGALTEAEAATTPAFSCRFTWSPADPLNYMRVLTPDDTQEPPGSEVALSAQAGRLVADITHAKAAGSTAPTYRAELVRAFERRQPNGKRHMLRHILLSCEQVRADASRTVYLQQLEVDTTLGSIDPIPCQTPARYAKLYAQDISSLAPTELPEKINGSPLRRDMLRLLYALAAIDTPEVAKIAAAELSAYAWQLAGKAPMPRSPWPHCWGEAADDAREIAQRLTPTLVYLQENDCFESGELAAFINSPVFSRIYGESFTHMPNEPVQETPIEYVPLEQDEP